ncbi:sigma-w pathway protein ysdB [Salimicrobium sp. PL1-032A]|uniref:sigma-w pathway protein ysdB n=1 Tax=Salimicrobium sp. PL1-032A TaxID=3095364 RepID=UPI00326000CF
MMVILFRILLLAAILFLVYTMIQIAKDPRRQFNTAVENRSFFFQDNKDNPKQNFFLTYKGAVFEGEKYVGTTEDSFEVISIIISAKEPEKLKGWIVRISISLKKKS